MKELTLPGLDAYAAEHTSPVPALLEDLARVTRAETTAPQMMVGRIEGAFLRMLVRLTRARRVVEVGTFTGYSALMMAEGLPEGGELHTCEISEKHAAIARTFFGRSPHGSRIRLHLGPALDTLRGMPAASAQMMFIDADKEGYPAYYEEALRILEPGGLLAADNVLWSGRVIEGDPDADTRALMAFNDRVRRDARVEHALLTVRDGIMLVVKR